MNHHVAPPERPTMSISAEGQVRQLRFDPDGCSIGPEIPEALLTRWKGMLADCGKAQGRMHRSYERFFKNQEAAISALRGLLEDATGIAGDLRDLANLFDMALDSEGVDGKLAEALRLVLGSMLTMSDRLDALEDQGDAACERHFV